MASFTIRRTTWCLEVLRTSRVFSVSLTTALPRRGRPGRLPSPPPTPLPFATRLRPTGRRTPSSQRHSSAAASRAFATSSRSQQPAAAQNPNPVGTQPSSQPPDSIAPTTDDLAKGLNDSSLEINESDGQVDWTRSFQGLSSEAFSPEAAKILLAPVDADDIEVKADGILYLPEIKYRRILNQAFGPGGWGLAPRGETIVTSKAVTREYALVVLGRLVSVARGEQDYFNPDNIPTAVEGCKSTALRRCCKDLGIASELWDPRFIREFMKANVKEVFVEHVVTKKRKKIYLRKADSPQYPWKETR